MQKRAIPFGVIALAVAAAYACGGGDGTAPHRTQVVQIANVGFPLPDAICTDPVEGIEVSYQLDFFVEMVNTTADSVAVTGVSSTGVVYASSRASDPQLGNTHVHEYAALPYEPTPVGLRAHDGDVTLHVTMHVPCGTDVVTADYSRTILTTLHVKTNSGQYNTTQLASHITWTHLIPADSSATS
jgi:hypothetical protein